MDKARRNMLTRIVKVTLDYLRALKRPAYLHEIFGEVSKICNTTESSVMAIMNRLAQEGAVIVCLSSQTYAWNPDHEKRLPPSPSPPSCEHCGKPLQGHSERSCASY